MGASGFRTAALLLLVYGARSLEEEPQGDDDECAQKQAQLLQIKSKRGEVDGQENVTTMNSGMLQTRQIFWRFGDYGKNNGEERCLKAITKRENGYDFKTVKHEKCNPSDEAFKWKAVKHTRKTYHVNAHGGGGHQKRDVFYLQSMKWTDQCIYPGSLHKHDKVYLQRCEKVNNYWESGAGPVELGWYRDRTNPHDSTQLKNWEPNLSPLGKEKCLDAGATDGRDPNPPDHIWMWDCHDGQNQKWKWA